MKYADIKIGETYIVNLPSQEEAYQSITEGDNPSVNSSMLKLHGTEIVVEFKHDSDLTVSGKDKYSDTWLYNAAWLRKKDLKDLELLL